MGQVDATNIKKGMKIEIDNAPFNVIQADYVKPGKGQAFTRVKIKNLKSGQCLEKTFKSNEKIDLADVEETAMRMLYKDADGSAVFMDDNTFEQVTIAPLLFGDEIDKWLKEELVYMIVFYKGEPVDLIPPNIIELTITETAPGDRGNTASGRVLKPATCDTGAVVQVPIFVGEGEKIRVDTRTGEYISRV